MSHVLKLSPLANIGIFMNNAKFKPLISLLLIFIAAPLLSALLTPWIYQAIQSQSAQVMEWVHTCEEAGTHTFWADIADSVFTSPFRRVNDRVVLILILLFLPISYRLSGLRSLDSLGWPRRPDRLKLFAGALGVAMASMLAVYLLGVALGVYAWDGASLPAAQLTAGILKILLGGLLIGILEETLFRGVILNAFSTGLGRVAGILITSILFAVIHFIKPAEPEVLNQWYSGLLLYQHPFSGASGTVGIEMSTLLCMGLVLGALTSWTKSVYVAIGLHTGWVWVMMLFRLLTENQQTMVWLYGTSEWISTGWVGPIMALMILAAAFVTRKKWIALGNVE